MGFILQDLLNILKCSVLPKNYPAISLMSREFANGPGDRGSISGQVIPKTQKMVLDAALTFSIIK